MTLAQAVEKENGGWAGFGETGSVRPREAYIHDAAIDIPKLLEAKEAGAMSTVVEDEALRGKGQSCLHGRR